MDRRLFLQIEMLKRTYAKIYILVEGDLFDTESAIAAESVIGALSFITVLEGIPVISTYNTAHTAATLLTMQRHALEGLGYEVPLRGSKPKSRAPQAQYLVEGLPSIGPSVAKKLLAHFGSALAIFNATPEQLKGVRGVGPKTIETIREVLEFKV
jgi:Fanconi anemia group M protein